MIKKLNLSVSVAALTVGAIAASQTALAQDADTDSESSETRTLSTVVVEARRKSENLQDVPVSVYSVSSDDLLDNAVDGFEDLRNLAPALNIEGGVDNNTLRIFIRGVGTATPTFGTENAVPIYIDDVYTPLGIGGNIDLFSVDRVEVLNGPQGTLYGRNSLGGAVKVYSKQFTNEAEGNASLTFGSFGQQNAKVEYQMPIIEDRLFVGFGYASINNDGIQKNVYTNTKGWQDDTELLRLRAEFRPTDNFTVKYSYEDNNSEGAAKQLRVRPGTAGLQPAGFEFLGQQVDNFYEIHQALLGGYNDALTQAHALGLDPTQYPLVNPGDSPFLIGTDNPFAGDVDNIFSDIVGDNVVEQESHTLNVAWDVTDRTTIRYIGSTREQFNTRLFDIDGSVNAFLAGTEEFTFEADSHELRFEHSADRFDFSAGVFRYEEKSDALLAFTQPFGIFAANNPIIELQNAVAAGDVSTIDFEPLVALQDPLGNYTGTNLFSLRNNLRQETTSTAFYANLSYEVTDKLTASFGIRNTEDEKFGETPVGNDDGGVLITSNTGLLPGTGQFTPAGGLRQFYTLDSLRAGFGVDQDVGGGAIDDEFGSIGDLEGDFNETTVEVTLDYKLNDDTLIYGSFKQGFQGGQLLPKFVPENEGGITATTTPIKINAYELGFKSTFGDNLRWNSAAYVYDWSDLILFQPVEVPVTSNTFQSVGIPINSATATSYGIESDLEFLVTDDFSISASVAWNEFSLDSATRFSSAAGGDIDVTDEFVDDFVPASPDLQATFGAEYFSDAFLGGETRFWGLVKWRDEMSVNAQSSFQNAGLNLLSPAQAQENFFSDSFTDVNAGITFEKGPNRVDFSVSNILDERRPVAVVNSIGGSFFGTLETYNTPRVWALTVSREF